MYELVHTHRFNIRLSCLYNRVGFQEPAFGAWHVPIRDSCIWLFSGDHSAREPIPQSFPSRSSDCSAGSARQGTCSSGSTDSQSACKIVSPLLVTQYAADCGHVAAQVGHIFILHSGWFQSVSKPNFGTHVGHDSLTMDRLGRIRGWSHIEHR